MHWLALVLLGFLLALPGASAQCDAAATFATADVELTFPHGDCARSNLDACPKLPEADAPIVLEGTLTWSSQTDTNCGVGLPSTSPVTINLQALLRSYAGWIDLRAEPAEIVIPVADQYDLSDDDIDLTGLQLNSQETYPVTVTISLVGEPSPEALASLEAANGGVQTWVKATMGATSSLPAAFNIEPFLLDGRQPAAQAADGRDAPALSPALVALALVAVAAVAVARRAPPPCP